MKITFDDLYGRTDTWRESLQWCLTAVKHAPATDVGLVTVK